MTALAGLGVEELTDAFVAGRVPEGEFTHADHVRVAWELLRRYPLGLALDEMTRGIDTLARQRGATGLYHATITGFYLLAIADRMARDGAFDGAFDGAAEGGFEEFAAAHPELLGASRPFLLAHYDPATLDSEVARRSFLLPERTPRTAAAE